MTHHTGNMADPDAPDPRGWAALSALSIFDVIGALWRKKLVMFVIFIVLFTLGMAGVMTLKKQYTSQGRILVQYGEEYIYNPVIGTAGQGTAYTADQMIQAEVGFFTASELPQRVLKKIGLRRIYPKLAKMYEEKPAKRAAILGAARQQMTKNLGAFTAPNQPLVTVTFRHKNPQIARDVLNAYIDEYLKYRRQVLLDSGKTGFANERETTEESLRRINKELQSFLTRYGIGDFMAERAAQSVRIAALRDQLLAAHSRQSEIIGALAAINAKLQSIPPTIKQYSDDTSAGQLADLKLQREQLLSKYKPLSKPVQAMNARINRLQSYLNNGGGGASGTTRTGVNTVYQGLQTSKLALEAEQQSNSRKIATLERQIKAVRGQQLKFQKLYPEYQRLANKADVMEKNYVRFAAREQEVLTRRNLAREQSDNIRVIERPMVPVRGKSFKKPAAILAFLFAAFTALSVGLLMALTNLANNPPRRLRRFVKDDPAPDGGGRGAGVPTPPRPPAPPPAPNPDMPVLADIGPQNRHA